MELTIAICDDEAAQADHLRHLVCEWAKERGIRTNCTVFRKAAEFEFHQSEGGGFDLLLLDVQMPGMDGMELARKLRAGGSRMQILFVSGYEEWIPQGYDVDAVHYLLKPVDQGKFNAALDKAAGRICREPRYVVFQVEEEKKRQEIDRILYAEAFSHDIELHTKDDTFRVRMPMHKLTELLGEGFLRCHRSYLVNIRDIQSIGRTELTLESGQKLPLSRSMYNKANEAFIQWNWRDH